MEESKFLILARISCSIQVIVCGEWWCTFGTEYRYCSNGCCYADGYCCDDDSDGTVGIIVGAVVGSVIFVAVVIAFCICCCKMVKIGQRSSTGVGVRPHNGTTIANVYTSQQSSSMQPPGYTQQGPPTNGYPQQGAYTNGYTQQGYPNQYPSQYPPYPLIYNDPAYPPQQGPPTK